MAGLIRSRDIENELRNRGFEPGVKYILAALAEQQIDQRRDVRLLAESIDQMTTILTSVVQVADNMKSAVEGLNKGLADDELGSSTQLIGRDG